MIEFQFDSFFNFLRMAPHGIYVWPVYGLGLLVIGGLAIWIRYQHRQAIRKIRRIMNRESIHEPKA